MSPFERLQYLCVPILVLSACERPAPPDPRVPPLTEVRSLTKPDHLLEVGGDCTPYGGQGCASGLCLKTTGDRLSGYVCSKRCTQDGDCPSRWGCVQVHAGSDGMVCAPPAAEGSPTPPMKATP